MAPHQKAECTHCQTMLIEALGFASALKAATTRLGILAANNDPTFDEERVKVQKLRTECQIFRSDFKAHAATHTSIDNSVLAAENDLELRLAGSESIVDGSER